MGTQEEEKDARYSIITTHKASLAIPMAEMEDQEPLSSGSQHVGCLEVVEMILNTHSNQ